MFGRSGSAKSTVTETAGSLSPYADALAHDEKLRSRLTAAITAGLAARERAKRQAGLVGLATRLGSDSVLRAQLAEVAVQLQAAKKRVQKNRSHKTRNTLLFMTGAGLVVAALPSLREGLLRKVRRGEDWVSGGLATGGVRTPTRIDEEIEVAVPVSTAYNQWTQFEEFPKFMEGVDEVKQLDDTLLHWAATVAGKKAEWDAKIVEQEPDRRIAWESVDGKRTRGTVTFEPAGPSRTRIRLNMSYVPEGITETAGSAVGLDNRRVRGDLERFRQLIESQAVASGAWRGEIKEGEKTGGGAKPA